MTGESLLIATIVGLSLFFGLMLIKSWLIPGWPGR